MAGIRLNDDAALRVLSPRLLSGNARSSGCLTFNAAVADDDALSRVR